MIDQSVKKNDLGIPGICMPGLCPVMPDQSVPKNDLGIGPGLCPIPGLC